MIIDCYASMTLRAIGELLDRDWQTVQQRVNMLIRRGVLSRHQRYYHRPWTVEDEDYLREYWGLFSDTTVAARLGRTPDACKIRATRYFHLARKHQFLMALNVAQIFGVDQHLVVRWIRDGLLRGRKSMVGCGGSYRSDRMWRIDDKDLKRFIRRHPEYYDWRPIEYHTYWRNLAKRVHCKDPLLTVDEAAAQLGVIPATLYRWLRQGRLTGIRVPRIGGPYQAWRIRQSAVSAFVVSKHGTTGRKLQ